MPLKIVVDLTTMKTDKMFHLSHSYIYHKSFILTGCFQYCFWTFCKTSWKSSNFWYMQANQTGLFNRRLNKQRCI